MSAVLILLCTFNGAAHLREQLDSLAAQDHADWTLWVSDDGSTDETRAIVTEFAATLSQDVHLIAGPRQGATANFLSLLCHPDLPLTLQTHVAFCDQDDIWYPTKLSRALDHLGQTAPGEPALYGAGYDLIDANGAKIGASPRLPIGGLRPNDPYTWNPIGGLTAVLNPAAVALARRAGAPDVPHHDWWVSLLVGATGGALVFDDTPVLAYRQHEANVIGASVASGGALRRIKGVLNGSYGAWIQANARALVATGLPLSDAALAHALCKPASGRARVATLRQHKLRRRDRLGTLALYLAAVAGRL